MTRPLSLAATLRFIGRISLTNFDAQLKNVYTLGRLKGLQEAMAMIRAQPGFWDSAWQRTDVAYDLIRAECDRRWEKAVRDVYRAQRLRKGVEEDAVDDER